MTPTYIAGYDGSDAARAALRFASWLAGTSGAEIIAATVYPGGRTSKAQEERADDETHSEARKAAEDVLAGSDVPDVVHCAVGARSPAEGLQRLAEEQDAALVVVGATHRGALGRLVPGSVGERLLHGAPCPVAVVPEAWKEEPAGVVAAAYDDGPEAQAALREATRLAGDLGARLVVIAVHEPLALGYAGAGFASAAYLGAETDAELRDELERKVNEAVAGLPSEVRAEARVLDGPAARTLVDACSEGVDVLVAGSRGYGRVQGVLLGSVSRHLVDHAPCPVVVVPRA